MYIDTTAEWYSKMIGKNFEEFDEYDLLICRACNQREKLITQRFRSMQEVNINSHLKKGQKLIIFNPQPGGDEMKLVECIFDDKIESINKIQVKYIGLTWAVEKAYLSD